MLPILNPLKPLTDDDDDEMMLMVMLMMMKMTMMYVWIESYLSV